MKIQRAVIGPVVITIGYLGALIWVDSRNQVLPRLPQLLSILPALFGLSLFTYAVRYLRWYWLLVRAGHRTSFGSGFLAYLAGFAFTATPGKVGELLRIRYLTPQGVPPWRVVAAFIYERAFDLIAVLALSAVVISRMDILILALGFVAIFLTGLLFGVLNPAWLSRASTSLHACRLKKLARICITLRDGLSGCRIWATPLDTMLSMALGVLAWSVTSFSFVWLLKHLGVSLPTLDAIPIYPLSMLAGAASLFPGGIGSTEVAIVALLSFHDVVLGTAMLAAIGIRFTSLWFAVLCGLFCAIIMELQFSGLMRRERERSSISRGN